MVPKDGDEVRAAAVARNEGSVSGFEAAASQPPRTAIQGERSGWRGERRSLPDARPGGASGSRNEKAVRLVPA